MLIEIYLENHDHGTPFEIANALIEHCIDKQYDSVAESLIALDEIADHIKVFVGHRKMLGVE